MDDLGGCPPLFLVQHPPGFAEDPWKKNKTYSPKWLFDGDLPLFDGVFQVPFFFVKKLLPPDKRKATDRSSPSSRMPLFSSGAVGFQ